MKNLSFQIKGNKVVFKIILNTISYYSTSDLVSEKFCQNLVDKASHTERLLSEINEGNEWLYLEELIIYSEYNLPLISFELNKGKRLRPEEKEAILAEIKNSIKELPNQFKTWKEYKDFLLTSIHTDLKRIFEYQWSRFGDTDDVQANKYMVKRILLCDWEGNITWSRDFEFNYTKNQILFKNKLKREDEIIKKWTQLL